MLRTAITANRRHARIRDELAQLLARAARGDTAAFMTFYDRSSPTAYHLVLALCGDPGRADDHVQRLYALAWARAGEQASSGLSPLAWLLSDVLSADQVSRKAG